MRRTLYSNAFINGMIHCLEKESFFGFDGERPGASGNGNKPISKIARKKKPRLGKIKNMKTVLRYGITECPKASLAKILSQNKNR